MGLCYERRHWRFFNPDGNMARLLAIAAFTEKNDMSVVTVDDIISYRKVREQTGKVS